MTRGEIWKDFFKRTVLPAVISFFTCVYASLSSKTHIVM